jgi:hypothetical protein
MRTRPAAVCVLGVALGAALIHGAPQDRPSALPAPVLLVSPAAAGSAQPGLAVGPKGQVWLSWLEPVASGGRRFRMAALDGSTFAAPITIAEGPNFLANFADVPSILVSTKGIIAAEWLETGSARGSYGVRVRTSPDGGRTWTGASSPHPADSPGEHGFVSFFEQPDGVIRLAWLDGRDAGGHGSGGGAMALRSAAIANEAVAGRGPRVGPEHVVDARVCDCCPTSAARTADGAVLAYRDRSDAEIRDISVARYANAEWSAPAVVHADGWHITGCPVNGPSIAASGASVAVGWFTQAGGTPEVRLAFSGDGGRRFDAPITIAAGDTLGRVAVAMPAADRALITYIARGAEGASLVVRDVRRGGVAGPATAISPMSPERSSGFPRIVVAGRRAVIAWTEFSRGAPTQVRVASAEWP